MTQRSSFRIPLRLGINYTENGILHNGTIKDMSETGMFVSADRIEFPENSIIKIDFPVKDESLLLSGKLVRQFRSEKSKSGFGIILIDPPQQYIDYIEELLLTL